jgi:hypothetical protein
MARMAVACGIGSRATAALRFRFNAIWFLMPDQRHTSMDQLFGVEPRKTRNASQPPANPLARWEKLSSLEATFDAA